MTPTQTHAALLTRMDAYLSGNSCEATAIIKDARALLAKLQPAQEPAQSIPPGLRVGDSHMESLIEAAIQGHAGTRDAMRWLVRQIARVEEKPAQAGELPPLPEPAAWRTSDEWPMCYQYTHEEPDEERISWAARYGRKHETVFTADQMHAYARAALSARKPLTMTDEQRLMFKNVEGMLDAYVACIRQYGDYEVWHYIPEVEAHRDDLASYVSEAHGINGLEVKT